MDMLIRGGFHNRLIRLAPFNVRKMVKIGATGPVIRVKSDPSTGCYVEHPEGRPMMLVTHYWPQVRDA